MRKKRSKQEPEYEILEPVYDKHGYEVVVLQDRDGIWRARHVHELVAETFIPNPGNKKYVRHKDGDILNNRADNLEWSDTPERM
jgi:hypothetical protein